MRGEHESLLKQSVGSRTAPGGEASWLCRATTQTLAPRQSRKTLPEWSRRARVLKEPLVLVYFYCYSHWDNEIIGIFFFLMRMRQNTLVAKWFSHRGKPLVSTWLLSNGGKLEHYTDISHDGPYFSCLFGVKWDGRNICRKHVVLWKVCSEKNRCGSRAGGWKLPWEASRELPAPARSMGRGALLVRNVRSTGARCWFPWAELHLNSRQYWLVKSVSKEAFVYFAKQHTRQTSVYLHGLSVWQVQPPGDLEAIWIVSEVTISLKKFFWADSVGAKPSGAPMNKF